jgi:uncharacterized repeat protein (TIGR02543 family)
MKTNWITLFAAAVLLQLPAGAAINETSAPRLTLETTSTTLTTNPDGSVDVTFKLTNSSTTSGGNAPVINQAKLSVTQITKTNVITNLYDVTTQILVGDFATTNLHFAQGTYYPPGSDTLPNGIAWTFQAQGIADDQSFGNLTNGTMPGQFVLSNQLVVNNATDPPHSLSNPPIPGNCTIEGTLSFTPLNFDYHRGTASLIIDTETTAVGAPPAGCPWVAGVTDLNAPASFTTISPTGGNGPPSGASVPTITVPANIQLNTSTNPRVIYVTLGSGANTTYSGRFPINQGGLTCAWTVTGFNPPQAGANPGSIQVNTGPDCLWSVLNTQGSFTITNASGTFTGSATLSYTMSPNNTCNPRNVSVSLGNITASATQPGLTCITAVVGTNVPGPSFLVDGTSYTGQQTLQWVSGSTHRLSVSSPQTPFPGTTQYRFASWSQGGTQSQTVAPTTNVTYTANFTTLYQLTTAVSPAGDGTVTPASGTFYKAGTAVIVSATPASGFNFLNWTGPVSNIFSAAPKVLMNAPVSVTANFTSQAVVTITLKTIPTGLSVVADGQTYSTPSSLKVVSGTPHQLSVASPQPSTPGTQYTFSSWSQGGAQTQTVTPNANAVYTAKFTTQYQLSTAVWGQGTGTVSPAGTSYYTAGTTVNVTATPSPGYVFVGWYGDPVSVNPSASFSMTQPQSAMAVFKQPITTFPLRVNTGLSYTDPAGNLWLGNDPSWFFGFTDSSDSCGYPGNTNTPDLYGTGGTSSYPLEFRAPIPNGSYQVKFKFAAGGVVDTAAFNVSLNGQPVLTNFDPNYVIGQYPVYFGWACTAFDELLPVQVTDGMLRVRWDPLSGQQAAINSIEVTPFPVRINAGGPAYTAPDGTQWSADTSTAGLILNTTTNITGTTTPALYQTQRYNAGASLDYTFPLGNGTYVVRLKFAELQYQSAGQRVFNVYLNDSPVEHNFDPFAAAGGANTAVDKVEAITVTNEALDIRLDPVVGNPAIAAIEVLPSTDIRIKAGGPGLADYPFFSGNTLLSTPVLWDGDHNYSGGQTFSSTLPVGQFLYQAVRYNAGPLDYNFLVPNGQYVVVLMFAEIENPATGNTFNVTINGTPELSNFNALVAAGAAYTPIDKWFKIPVSAGLLNIHFDGQPEIAAIEIHSLLSDGSWEPQPIVAPNPPVVVP